MKKEYSAIYTEPRTFKKYDHGRIIGYLNEEVIEDYVPETSGEDEESPEPCTGYKYTGTEPDGGTIMDCEDAADLGCVANAIIRTEYTESNEMAIQRHAINGDYKEKPAEYDEYNAFCVAAVALAKAWMGVE